jgi:MFS family permease
VTDQTSTPRLSPWRFIVTFGVVSLLADLVYEGARSIVGPLLASLGASAALVGLITGVGEAAALVLRLGFGPLADRTRRFWALTIAGYTLTVVSVPLLGTTGVLWLACALVLAERVGKAVRSPAKDTLIAQATSAVGRGRGFAVHEAMDQIGALLGPLIVAATVAITGRYGPALVILTAPAVGVLALLVWLRLRVPDPVAYEKPNASQESGPLPRTFWLYGAFSALTMCGFATFAVLSFHLATRGVLPVAAIPVVYAAAMAVDAVAALASGWLYDRTGLRVLIAQPLLAVLVPVLAFTTSPAVAILGSLAWGASLGVQESTMRAAVADLVPGNRRATAYGMFAALYGGATAIGGLLAGALYQHSLTTLIILTALIQALALVLLLASGLTRSRQVV